MNPIVELMTTVADPADAHRLARLLVEEGLAACVHVDGIRATYRWEGRLCEDEEIRLWIKTSPARAHALTARVRELHPYDTPALIRIDAQANPEYARWVADQVERGDA